MNPRYYRHSASISLLSILLLAITLSMIVFSFLSSSLLFSAANAFHLAKEYVFVKKWGSKGTGDGQFQRPHDLDFDPQEKYLYTLEIVFTDMI
jgi:hypothetical protein